MSRLVLTRRLHEGVVLRLAGGPVVYIAVAKIGGDGERVRLSIDAPTTVAVHREEVALDMLRERLDELPAVATTEEECERVRACASLIDAAKVVAQSGDGERRSAAQRLLDRLAGLGRLNRPAHHPPASA